MMIWRVLILFITISVTPVSYAYVGPGAGLSVLGSVITFLGAILLLLIGLFWFPLKRLIKKIKHKPNQNNIEKKEEAEEQDDTHHE
ncbi:hypothetical protein [Vibrio salinus]|uniref:hypothetical protein n=1 Tax=Vibrio salinus TaxID=2899784 RepID=UPI001E530ABC|nr:hypothetical protein [Vibrio salinus]MCE0494145.1 hypothetical protein [Vibrio salinus]